MSITVEELESLPPETHAIRLEPDVTYLLLVDRRAVSQEVCRRIPGAFEKMGLRPPMILTVLDPEKDVKLYALKRED
jgi:hypothetical protein